MRNFFALNEHRLPGFFKHKYVGLFCGGGEVETFHSSHLKKIMYFNRLQNYLSLQVDKILNRLC